MLSLLDQKTGREKSILRRSIQALDRLIREKEAEKPHTGGYPYERASPGRRTRHKKAADPRGESPS